MPLRTVAYLSPLCFDDESYVGGGQRYPLGRTESEPAILHDAGQIDRGLPSPVAEPSLRPLVGR